MYEGVNYPFDYVSADTFDGVSTLSSIFTVNSAGTIVPNQTSTLTYVVTTTNATTVLHRYQPGPRRHRGAKR